MTLRVALAGLFLGASLPAAPYLQAQQVRGSVVDQVTGAPIRGATVHLLTPDHRTLETSITDEDGRYALRVREAGEYFLLAQVTGYASLLSPSLSLIGGETRSHVFEVATLAGAEPSEESVDVETLAQALALICEDRHDSKDQGILVGVVRDSVSSLPLSDVRTRLEWSDDGRVRSKEIVTGDDGSFVFCDAPAGAGRVLTAEIAGAVAPSEVFQVNAGMIKRKDVLINLSDVDRPGDVLGRVTDFESGDPIVGAEVRLKGTSFSAVTGDSGNFTFQEVPWGVYFIEIDHIAYESQSRPLRIMGDQAHDVEVRLASEAMELDPISVEIRSRDWFGGMRDFRERRSRGFGYFMDRKDIERRGGVNVLDLLREIPGVNVEMARAAADNPGRTTTQAIYFRNCWRYTENGDQLFTPPVFYLNGVKQASLDLARGDLDTVRPADIEAIEVYRGAAEVPADFGGTDAGCGVIAIWTKRG